MQPFATKMQSLKAKIKNIDEQNKAHEAELEERLNQTGNELNKLKGDYFDLSAYADELEARLASSAKPSENGGNDENKTEKNCRLRQKNLTSPYCRCN